MAAARKDAWTEYDLLNFRGVPESARLEFKASQLLSETNHTVALDLSREVSAFANSEGGLIVIGVKERQEGKSRVGDDLDDGIDAAARSSESFQRLIEGNLSPYLPGIRIFRVALGGTRTGRIALVIDVPAGSTAYQAADKRYYGRSEHETKALPDHEIRMRMMRGRIPMADLAVHTFTCLTAEDEHAGRLRELHRPSEDDFVFIHPERMELLKAPKRDHDEYILSFQVMNSGEATIRDFVLVIDVTFATEIVGARSNLDELTPMRWRFAQGRQTWRGMTHEIGVPDRVIFPSDRFDFPESPMSVQVPAGRLVHEGDVVLRWTIFLDDAVPCSGEIDLGVLFKRSARAAS